MDHRLIINCVKTEFAVSHTLRIIIIKTQHDVTYNYLRKKSLFVKKTMVLFQRKQYVAKINRTQIPTRLDLKKYINATIN